MTTKKITSLSIGNAELTIPNLGFPFKNKIELQWTRTAHTEGDFNFIFDNVPHDGYIYWVVQNQLSQNILNLTTNDSILYSIVALSVVGSGIICQEIPRHWGNNLGGYVKEGCSIQGSISKFGSTSLANNKLYLFY